MQICWLTLSSSRRSRASRRPASTRPAAARRGRRPTRRSGRPVRPATGPRAGSASSSRAMSALVFQLAELPQHVAADRFLVVPLGRHAQRLVAVDRHAPRGGRRRGRTACGARRAARRSAPPGRRRLSSSPRPRIFHVIEQIAVGVLGPQVGDALVHLAEQRLARRRRR